MTIATKSLTKTVTKKVKVTTPKVSAKKTPTVEEHREREKQRRNEEKSEILEKYTTSQEIFEQLAQEIRTLSDDESSHDLSVGDDYNFGVEYEVELLMEVLSDLRWFTRLSKDEDDKTIEQFNLDYIRQYWND